MTPSVLGLACLTAGLVIGLIWGRLGGSHE